MDHVEKFDTMLSKMYQIKYEPSACKINPYVLCIEHKTRARLDEVHLRNRYRRSLSALLNEKPVNATLDRNHSSLNTLHKFERGLQGKVSQAAPSKAHQKYAALRQGRDPRMNAVNAHFDAEHAKKLFKENQGFNVGRHEGQRPSTAVLAWRPHDPFLTYEKAPMTHGEAQNFTAKQLHAKVMNDRVQVYNQKFVPEHLLPKQQLAWVKEDRARKPLKRANSVEHLAINDAQSRMQEQRQASRQVPSEEHVDRKEKEAVDLAVKGAQSEDEDGDKENVPENSQKAEAPQGEGTDQAKLEVEQPSKILEQMRQSNIKDIIRSMTVHEQLRMIRNIIEDEEFKRRSKLRSERESREAERLRHKAERKIGREAVEGQARSDCEEVKGLDEMTYDELVNQKPDQAIKGEGPLPLTEGNLSAMVQVGAARAQSPQRDRIKEDVENVVNPRPRIKPNTDLDLSKLQKQEKLLSQGWTRAPQMDQSEIEKRQKAPTKEIAKKIARIVERNQLGQVPPVPRLVTGHH